ncbi:MAG: putative bifunctional diguanylate cyclase/phosphodiesterase [Sandaracinaceae bacterium]
MKASEAHRAEATEISTLSLVSQRRDATHRPLLRLAAATTRCPIALLYRLPRSVEADAMAFLVDAYGPSEAVSGLPSEVPAQWLERTELAVLPRIDADGRESLLLPHDYARSLISLPLLRNGRHLATLLLVDAEVREDLPGLDREALQTLGDLLVSSLSPGVKRISLPPRRAPRVAEGGHAVDPVTGLPERREVLRRLARAVRDARDGGRGFALAIVALDRFRRVNDWLGRAVADELMHQVAERLLDVADEDDFVGRSSGDELLVMLGGLDRPGSAPARAHRVLQSIEEPFHVHGYDVSITASLGVACFPDDAQDGDTLLRYAGIALHRAKDRGRGRLQVFTNRMKEAVETRGDIERSLRLGLGRGELELHYQPKVDLANRAITGVEALLRWRRQDRLVMPGEFIGVAEESGLIVPIGAFVLLESCRQMRRWLDAGLPLATMAVNVSPHQFSRPDFVGTIGRALAASGLPAANLELEVTEGSLMSDVEQAAERLGALRRLGVRVAVDDFGTGYSSLAYLQRLPVDLLKIDRSFVKDLDGSSQLAEPARALAGAIAGLGRALGLRVLAEGVETTAPLRAVADLGCEEVQGYFFGRPVPPAEIPAIASIIPVVGVEPRRDGE